MNLYKLNEKHMELIKQLEDLADSNDGEAVARVLDEFSALETDTDAKLESYVWAIRMLEDQQAAAAREAKRVERILFTTKQTLGRLEESLKFTMEKVLNLEEKKVGTFKIGFVGCKKSVQVTNVANVPAEYTVTAPAVTAPDKKAIYTLLTSPEGENVTWAKLVGGRRFFIK